MKGLVAHEASIVLAFGAWAVVHSLLADPRAKRRARLLFGPGSARWYRIAYNLFALGTLLPVLGLPALLPDLPLYSVAAPWSWLLVAVQLLSAAGIALTARQTGGAALAGLAQLSGDPRPPRLAVGGLYRYVRHPLYLLGLILLWAAPEMSLNRATLYGLMSLYFYLGSIHEEKLLTAELGDAYNDYRSQVARILPWPGRVYRGPTPAAEAKAGRL